MDTSTIETFPSPSSHPCLIRHTALEFTSLCPKTQHPDFGQIILSYIPHQHCIELKAYKLYLQSYRNKGIFYEDITHKIAKDLNCLLQPQWIRLESFWSRRGGLHTDISVEYQKENFHGNTPKPTPRPPL